MQERRYFTPGPSELFPTVKTYIQEALTRNLLSQSHRSREFQSMAEDTKTGLRALLGIPPEHRIFFLSSATEAMERTIQNCVGSQSFHFVNGAFAERFYQTAVELNKKPRQYRVEDGQGFDFSNTDIPPETELLCLTQNETSTGVAFKEADIADLKRRHPDMLVAVDVVSSVPYVDLNYSLTDSVFFSVQKGFGLPAGLGAVIVSPQAMEKARMLQRSISIGSYHSFLSLEQYDQKNQTPETPNVLGIYLLGRVAAEMNEYGIDRIRVETDEKAAILYNCFDNAPRYDPAVKERQLRSKTVIVVNVPSGAQKVIETLGEASIAIEGGYRDKTHQFRIANFPAHRRMDVDLIVSLLR